MKLLANVQRQGRFRRHSTPNSLPLVFVETGSNLPQDVSNELWVLPNSRFIVRVDTRLERDLITSDENSFNIVNPIASTFAAQTAFVVDTLFQRYQSTLAVVGKAVEYALMTVGPDAPNSDKFITKDPTNGWVTNPGAASLFRGSGVDDTRDFVLEAFDALKTELDNLGRPYPELLLLDLESIGDTVGGGPYGLDNVQWISPTFPTAGDGYMQLADTDRELAPFVGALKDFLGPNQLTQDNQSLDPFDPLVTTAPPSGNPAINSVPGDPTNFEALFLATAACKVNFIAALDSAMAQPFAATFGVNVWGEWNVFTETQLHQSPTWPRCRSHFFGTTGPFPRQVVINYSDTPNNYAYSALPDSTAATDIRWATPWNWLYAEQPAGFDPSQSYPTGGYPPIDDPALLRAALAVRTRQAQKAAVAAPDKPLLPAVAIGGTAAERRAMIPFLVRYMVTCATLGAREFWLWAPDWNTGVTGVATAQEIRETNRNLVVAFNKRIKARCPRRNRIWRRSA